MYYKGRVSAVHRGSGCWEVVVQGEHPGAFPIDNCCISSIVAAEGADWIGRQVEYRDGCVRFLNRHSTRRDDEQLSASSSSRRTIATPTPMHSTKLSTG